MVPFLSIHLSYNRDTQLMELQNEHGDLIEAVPMGQAIRRKSELLHAAAVASGVRTVEASPFKKHRNEVL